MNNIFGLNFITITQIVATNRKESTLTAMQESRVQFAVSECKAFLYEIDNWAKNSIDSFFGGGILDSSPKANIIGKVFLIFFVCLWFFLIFLYLKNVKQDHDYTYYYHEEPHMYTKIFKYFTPMFILIPIIGIFIGTHTANKELKQTNQPVQQIDFNAPAFKNYQSKPFDDNNQPGLDGISNKDKDFVNRAVAEGKANLIAYSDVQSQSNIQTNRNNRYHLVVVSEPHFKLSAYKHPDKVGAYVYAVYGILISLVGMGALIIWHGNADQDQW